MQLDPPVEHLIKAIHACATKAVLFTTGGAAQAGSWLLSVPGASNTVIELMTPYSRESLVSVLGAEPEQFCSEATAVLMAKAAYRRAAALSGLGTAFIGAAATCALASVPVKRGEHRAFISCHGSFGTKTVSIVLAKGERDRIGEDDLTSRAVLKLMAECMDVDTESFRLPTLAAAPAGEEEPRQGDVLQESWQRPQDPVQALLSGAVSCVEYGPGGGVVVDAPRSRKIVLPGSFNPLHDGHRQMLQAAVERFGGPDVEGCFELSVANADKGMLSADEVRRRVGQFTAAGLAVVLTAAPLFTLKAALMKRCKFVVGYDTAYRLVLPKYYGDSHTQMLLDFMRLRIQGCSLIVAGRVDAGSGAFKGLADVAMPPELADLFEELPESLFRLDVSSTELRKKMMSQ